MVLFNIILLSLHFKRVMSFLDRERIEPNTFSLNASNGNNKAFISGIKIVGTLQTKDLNEHQGK